MPNTDPVVDSAPLLRSLRDTAAREASVPVGFLPAITRGLLGEQLTEMAELREEGALGFTDDGKPVQSAGMLRKALQYQRLCGGVIALHEEDPTLSRGGSMHEGAVSAALGIAGIPTVAESTMVARDAALAAYEDARVHFQHLSCADSVQALAVAKARGSRVSAEVTPASPAADRGGRPRSRHTHEDAPAAGHRGRPARAHRGAAERRRSTASRPTTPRTPATRRRSRSSRPRWGRPGSRRRSRRSTAASSCRGCSSCALLVERMSAGAALFGLPAPRVEVGAVADLALLDLDAEWVGGRARLGEPLGELLLRRAARCAGACC